MSGPLQSLMIILRLRHSPDQEGDSSRRNVPRGRAGVSLAELMRVEQRFLTRGPDPESLTFPHTSSRFTHCSSDRRRLTANRVQDCSGPHPPVKLTSPVNSNPGSRSPVSSEYWRQGNAYSCCRYGTGLALGSDGLSVTNHAPGKRQKDDNRG